MSRLLAQHGEPYALERREITHQRIARLAARLGASVALGQRSRRLRASPNPGLGKLQRVENARRLALKQQALVAAILSRAFEIRPGSGTHAARGASQRQRLAQRDPGELGPAAAVLLPEPVIGAQVHRGVRPGAGLGQLAGARRKLGLGGADFRSDLHRAPDNGLQGPTCLSGHRDKRWGCCQPTRYEHPRYEENSFLRSIRYSFQHQPTRIRISIFIKDCA